MKFKWDFQFLCFIDCCQICEVALLVQNIMVKYYPAPLSSYPAKPSLQQRRLSCCVSQLYQDYNPFNMLYSYFSTEHHGYSFHSSKQKLSLNHHSDLAWSKQIISAVQWHLIIISDSRVWSHKINQDAKHYCPVWSQELDCLLERVPRQLQVFGPGAYWS